MKRLTSLNSSARQSATIALDDGSQVVFTIQYVPNQQGWFYSITRYPFTTGLRRLVVSPNLLRAFRKIIPFGFACTSTDGYEPIFINDFSTQRINLYLLNADDVVAAEELITLTIPNIQGTFLN